MARATTQRAEAILPARWSAELQRQWWQRTPAPLAQLLRPLSWLYAVAFAVVRRLIRPVALPVPVVVVGNLVVGGAGKTPTVMAVVQLLRAFGWTPGVVSRGHGRESNQRLAVTRESLASQVGDEPLLIHLRTGAPVMVSRDRVGAARALLAQHPQVDVLVSDDGLQHHRLARDVQIVVFDDRGSGNGLLLPAGPLREPMPRHAPPDTLLLYNAARVSTLLPGWMATRRLAGVVPLADWWQGAVPVDDSWRALRGRSVLALAGMAEPERFFALLEAVGLTIERLPLPDHHAFRSLPWPHGTADVVLTEKDAVKLVPGREGEATTVWVVPLDFEPELAFTAALKRQLPHPPHHVTSPPMPAPKALA